MSEAYRQKLLNWFCSMALLVLTTTLATSIAWFRHFPESIRGPGNIDIYWIASAISDNLLTYAIYFVPMVFWHLFDFIERSEPASLWTRSVASYRPLILLLFATMVLWLAVVAGLWEYNSCDELQGALHYACYVELSDWLFVPWMIGMGLALLLCIAKAVISIRSRLTKAP